jgi:hypothetical protein
MSIALAAAEIKLRSTYAFEQLCLARPNAGAGFKNERELEAGQLTVRRVTESLPQPLWSRSQLGDHRCVREPRSSDTGGLSLCEVSQTGDLSDIQEIQTVVVMTRVPGFVD